MFSPAKNTRSTTALEGIALLYLYQIKKISAHHSESLTIHKLIRIWDFWLTKLLRIFVALSRQVLLLLLCKKSKSSSECSLSFIAPLSSEASYASNFSCNELVTLALNVCCIPLYTQKCFIIFDFDRHHKWYETADAEMLQLHINCWQAYLDPFFGVNRTDIFWS